MEQELEMGTKIKTEELASKSKLGFRLTERDVEILGFLLDQKFASLEQIYFRQKAKRAFICLSL